jgi:transposase
LGKIEIWLGTLVATNERIDGAVNPSIDQLKEWLKQTQPNIHVGETPWLVKGIKEWLWIFANTDFALFHAADTRSRAELDAILGSSYSGVLSSDDYSAYNGYPVKAKQKCLAHLRRHFKKLLKLPGLNNQEIETFFISLVDETFKNYALFQQNQNSDEFLSWTSGFKLQHFRMLGGTIESTKNNIPMKAYSVDLRLKIVTAHKRAESVDQKNSRNIWRD